MNKILMTAAMLEKCGYKNVVVCVEDLLKTRRELYLDLKSNMNLILTQKILNLGEARFSFFEHKNDYDLHNLVGINCDAAIIEGNPSKDFTDILCLGLRIGDNPIRVYI